MKNEKYTFINEVKSGPTPRDLLISTLVALFERNKQKPGTFTDKINKVIVELFKGGEVVSSTETLVPESELPVVNELNEVLSRAKREGFYPDSSAINPFNRTAEHPNLPESFSKSRWVFFGDIHQPGADPSEAAVLRNKFYRWLQEHHPRQLAANIANKENSKLPESEQLSDESWNFEGEGVARKLGFNVLKEAVRRDVVENFKKDKADVAVVMVNIGDNGHTESSAGDLALTLLEQEQFRVVTSDEIGQHVPLVSQTGNHDTDTQNHGLEQDFFIRESLGSQIFAQEIGNTTVVLSIDTNFYSSFWRKDVLKRIRFLRRQQKRLEKSKKSGSNQVEVSRLESWCQKQEETLDLIEKDYVRQKQVIEFAKNSGKNIVLTGHDGEYFEEAVGPLSETKIIVTASGHTHDFGKSEDILNIDGKPIQQVVVGTKLEDVDSVEHSPVQMMRGWSIQVEANESREDTVTIDPIEPSDSDIDKALFLADGI